MNSKNNIYRRPPAAGGKASNLVVFLHGYGADGKDLIDLANPFSMAMPNASFISPDAPHPCAMSPSGRQWFRIEEIPDGAIHASEDLLNLLKTEAKNLSQPHAADLQTDQGDILFGGKLVQSDLEVLPIL